MLLPSLLQKGQLLWLEHVIYKYKYMCKCSWGVHGKARHLGIHGQNPPTNPLPAHNMLLLFLCRSSPLPGSPSVRLAHCILCMTLSRFLLPLPAIMTCSVQSCFLTEGAISSYMHKQRISSQRIPPLYSPKIPSVPPCMNRSHRTLLPLAHCLSPLTKQRGLYRPPLSFSAWDVPRCNRSNFLDHLLPY